MEKPAAWIIAAISLFSITILAQEYHRYPWSEPPRVTLERTGENTARVAADGINTNLWVSLAEASSVNGPWVWSSGELDLTSSNRFIKAVVDVQNFRINQ